MLVLTRLQTCHADNHEVYPQGWITVQHRATGEEFHVAAYFDQGRVKFLLDGAKEVFDIRRSELEPR